MDMNITSEHEAQLPQVSAQTYSPEWFKLEDKILTIEKCPTSDCRGTKIMLEDIGPLSVVVPSTPYTDFFQLAYEGQCPRCGTLFSGMLIRRIP